MGPKPWRAGLKPLAECSTLPFRRQCATRGCAHADSNLWRFLQARPRYWETYARIRRAIPALPESHAIVMGGFIGATVDGRTTLLGRGGSDLTATIVGAALNAREIQIWKDVDGMLTCDPRLKSGALLVKHLSYNEAATLARQAQRFSTPIR